MTEFVEDCPRCGSKKVTFEARSDNCLNIGRLPANFEAFVICRNCNKASIAKFIMLAGANINSAYANSGVISTGNASVSSLFKFNGFVTVEGNVQIPPPEFLPEGVANCFREGAAAFAIGAYNASAAMFRLSLDIASKTLLPLVSAEEGGPNSIQRKRLHDRLAYLFDKQLLAPDLRDLADCIREDGNDGAHDGTLTKADAEDLIDFSQALLERVYTEPARLEQAKARRMERRAAMGQITGSA